MKLSKFFFITFLVALCCNIAVFQGQTRKQLEETSKQLKQEIAKVNKLLFAAQKSEKNALDDLDDINKKIVARTNYIQSINKETSLLSSEIGKNEKGINKLSKQLEKNKVIESLFKQKKLKS